MTLQQYFTVLRESWLRVLAAVLIGGVLGALVTLVTPTQYVATVTFYISSQNSPAASSTDAYQGSLLSQERIKSYTQLLSSYRVADDVRNGLRLNEDVEDIAESITASVNPDTVLLTANVTDGSSDRAVAIAQALQRNFPALISELERPIGSGAAPTVAAQVVQGARLDETPAAPRPVLYIALGLTVGLVAGVAFVTIRRALDQSIRTIDQLRTSSGLPVLGAVPNDDAIDEAPLFMRDRPTEKSAEGARTVRAAFELLNFDRENTCFLVTSAHESEGKSTLTANLAYAEALAGKRVLVVEGDLRRPRAALCLGLTNDVGLTQVLGGRADVASVLQPGPIRQLDFLGSGPLPPNPYEMLQSKQMSSLVEDLKRRYDTVLIDSPPMLPVADGLAIAKIADGALLVVRAGRTPEKAMLRALELLRAADVRDFGCVLNGVSSGQSSSYYHYSMPREMVADQTVIPAEDERGGRPSPRRREEAEYPFASDTDQFNSRKWQSR